MEEKYRFNVVLNFMMTTFEEHILFNSPQNENLN